VTVTNVRGTCVFLSGSTDSAMSTVRSRGTNRRARCGPDGSAPCGLPCDGPELTGNRGAAPRPTCASPPARRPTPQSQAAKQRQAGLVIVLACLVGGLGQLLDGAPALARALLEYPDRVVVVAVAAQRSGGSSGTPIGTVSVPRRTDAPGPHGSAGSRWPGTRDPTETSVASATATASTAATRRPTW
jgi:hypothetical protein